jgi:hypothetical protein
MRQESDQGLACRITVVPVGKCSFAQSASARRSSRSTRQGGPLVMFVVNADSCFAHEETSVIPMMRKMMLEQVRPGGWAVMKKEEGDLNRICTWRVFYGLIKTLRT